MKQMPVAIGLLLCENAIVEERTRNISPINCFSLRRAEAFPSEPIPFTVLAFLTDGQGEVDLTVLIEDSEAGEEIYQRKMRGRFDNPLAGYRVHLRVMDCRFPRPGRYHAVLLGDDQFLAHRTFQVLPKESAP